MIIIITIAILILVIAAIIIYIFLKKGDNDKPNPLLSDEISDTTSKEINPKDPIITEPDSSNNIISTLPSHDSNFPTSPTIDITTTPISVSTNTDNI